MLAKDSYPLITSEIVQAGLLIGCGLCQSVIAARVVEVKNQIRLHLPTSCLDQLILRIVLSRIPQLAT